MTVWPPGGGPAGREGMPGAPMGVPKPQTDTPMAPSAAPAAPGAAMAPPAPRVQRFWRVEPESVQTMPVPTAPQGEVGIAPAPMPLTPTAPSNNTASSSGIRPPVG